MIKFDRIRQTLVELVQIDSHSRHERQVAEYLTRRLAELGAAVEVDDAGAHVGGDTGNVIARLPGNIDGATPFLLSAHMDTVTPGEGVKPVVEDGVVRSDGTTILGGDDKSGIAVILETLHVLQEQSVPHTGIEVVFSICEEVGLLGAKHVDESKLKAKHGLIFDADEPSKLYTKSPTSVHIEVDVHGLEAHAGVAPEEGISAIRIASEAIAAMRLGRIDAETTANIGIIEGGKATNIITNLVRLQGEARSMDKAKLDAQVEHMTSLFEQAAERATATVNNETKRARVDVRVDRSYPGVNIADDSHLVQLVTQAAEKLGRRVETLSSGGGTDANIYNGKGIECANLGSGQRAIHTINEWVDVADMCHAAELAVEVIRLNGESAAQQQQQ